MKLNAFFGKHLVDGCITGTFTTSKSIDDISKKEKVSFDLTLQKDNDQVTFIVPSENKKPDVEEGVLRKTLLLERITTEAIFLRWIPENRQGFEGFNVKLISQSDSGGRFFLSTDSERFSFWSHQLTSVETMRGS